MSGWFGEYVEAAGERDELQGRIDAVLALAAEAEREPTSLNAVWTSALKAALAPPPAPALPVERAAGTEK